MNTIKYDGKEYLELQSKGFAAQYAFPFAKQILTGNGIDIGPNRKEWAFPGARMIDLVMPDEFDAFNLPNEKYVGCRAMAFLNFGPNVMYFVVGRILKY